MKRPFSYSIRLIALVLPLCSCSTPRSEILAGLDKCSEECLTVELAYYPPTYPTLDWPPCEIGPENAWIVELDESGLDELEKSCTASRYRSWVRHDYSNCGGLEEGQINTMALCIDQ